MNKVELIGRLTKDPEVKLTQNQTPFCNFTVAVDRRFKDQSGNRQADFINCVAWQKTAQFLQKYFKKGNRVGICGCIQVRSFDKDGQKVFITEVLAEEIEFVENIINGKTAEPEEHQENQEPVAPTESEAQKDLPFEI